MLLPSSQRSPLKRQDNSAKNPIKFSATKHQTGTSWYVVCDKNIMHDIIPSRDQPPSDSGFLHFTGFASAETRIPGSNRPDRTSSKLLTLGCLCGLEMSREANHKPVFSFHHISPVHVADQMNFEPRPSYPTENRDRTMPATRACCARRGFRKREGSSHQVVCGQPQLSEHGRNISYRVKT